MSKKYPRIRDSYKKPRKPGHPQHNQGKPCLICGRPTIGGWWVQTSWFRGDDEIARACDEHYGPKHRQELLVAWCHSEAASE